VVTMTGSGILGISGNISESGGSQSLTLTGDGSGQLILSGSNTYSGGTIVNDGTLVVDSPSSLLEGSTLLVGLNAASIFAPASPPSPAGASAVPEPSTMALFGAGAIGLACYGWRRRKRRLR
jgi:autotransporter-associated beta strand protein